MKNYNRINIYTNGIDAETGLPVINNFTLKDFSENILLKIEPYYKSFVRKAGYTSPGDIHKLYLYKQIEKNKAGWGLLINKKDKEIEEELRALVKYRNGKIIYYENEPVQTFFDKYNGWDKEFKKLPYYLLIAGSPESVPLKLQYLLDVSRSVGRIFFYKQGEYEKYARKIIDYKPAVPEKILFFGTAHNRFDPTFYSLKYMVKPLINKMKVAGFKTDKLLKYNATEKKLFKQMDKHKYDIFFSATHGLGLKEHNTDKKYLQGAIVCQDIKYGSNLIQNNQGLITGRDIEHGKNINAKVWFMFACYSGGTLKKSDFSFWVPEYISESLKEYQAQKKSFFGYLPQTLLASENGPYAVIAHIDPAWIFSFMDEERNNVRLMPFVLALKRLMHKVTVGRSIRDFNSRYAQYSVMLLNYVMDHLERKEKINPLSLSNIWVARQDSQNYILFGDPAFSL